MLVNCQSLHCHARSYVNCYILREIPHFRPGICPLVIFMCMAVGICRAEVIADLTVDELDVAIGTVE